MSRAGERNRLLGDGRDAVAIDVLHREDVHARLTDDLLFAFVEIADADEDGVLGQHLRREAADPRQLGGLGAEQRRERHAVDVAAGRTRRRVHVAVRVDPDQADRLLLPADEIGRRGDRSGRQAVIAAEDERKPALLERRERGLVQLLADPGDLADVFLAGIAERFRFRDRRDDIPFVDDRHAERGQPFANARDPKRGRSHVDAAAVAAEVERHADDVNRTHVWANCTHSAARLTSAVNLGYSKVCGGQPGLSAQGARHEAVRRWRPGRRANLRSGIR